MQRVNQFDSHVTRYKIDILNKYFPMKTFLLMLFSVFALGFFIGYLFCTFMNISCIETLFSLKLQGINP